MVSRSDVATKEDVERVLADRDAEAEAKEQERLKKLFSSRARLTPKERKIGHGLVLESHYRKTGNRDGLADALAMQGKFLEAAETAQSLERVKVFLEKYGAVMCPDDDCDCPSFEERHGLRIPTQYVQSYEISQKHGGQMLPAIRCRKCNTLNIRPQLEHLQEQRAARAKSVANVNSQVKASEFFKT